MGTIEAELWGDLIDPWSWIATRRLAQAVGRSRRPADVVVTHRALPGPAATSEGLAQSAVEGRPDGVDIRVATPPQQDTLPAHRLLALGLDLGGPALQGAVIERLFAAVFTEGLDVGSPEVLLRVAPEAGIDEGRVSALLDSRDLAGQVAADVAAAQALGLTRAPALVMGDEVAIVGVAGTQDYADLLGRFVGPA